MLRIAEPPTLDAAQLSATSRVAVIWVDWYFYHVARFRALVERSVAVDQVVGIELVGGAGVHAGYNFRDDRRGTLPIQTLFPGAAWSEVTGLSLALNLWRCLAKLRPSLILIPGYYTVPAIAAAVWGRLHHRRTVLMTETTGHDHPRSWWKERLKGILIRLLFDWAIAGGNAHRRYLIQLGFCSDRIASFYDIVDNEYFSQRTTALRKHSSAQEFGLPERYFLYVGRFAEEKNVAALISAYVDYRCAGGSWSLVLVGDGPLLETLQATAAAANHRADIHFEGLAKSADLPQYYAFAGCFVLPSSREPWGLVVNEAMASSLPVIVSNRCGCAEDLVSQSENGFVFDPTKPNQLLECLQIISESGPQKLTAMGERSCEIISSFTPRAWADEVVRIAGEQR